MRPNSSVPAADRVVPLDHNSADYKETIGALETLERVLEQANDYPDPEEKDQRIAELSAVHRLMASTKVRIAVVLSLLTPILTQFTTKFADTLIGKAANFLWDKLRASVEVFLLRGFSPGRSLRSIKTPAGTSPRSGASAPPRGLPRRLPRRSGAMRCLILLVRGRDSNPRPTHYETVGGFAAATVAASHCMT